MLRGEPQIDVVLRGDDEATALRLVGALEHGDDLAAVEGIAFRRDGEIVATRPAAVIDNLDAYRVGWELISHRNYSYYGGMRAVVMQFSRGCPHRWTPYYRLAQDRRVIQLDQRRWDYKHQVLASRHMPAWRLMLWVKAIEVLVQARPKALLRTFFHPDRRLRHGMRWYARIGRRVWFHEWKQFLFRERRVTNGPTLRAFWGEPQDHEEVPLRPNRRETTVATAEPEPVASIAR